MSPPSPTSPPPPTSPPHPHCSHLLVVSLVYVVRLSRVTDLFAYFHNSVCSSKVVFCFFDSVFIFIHRRCSMPPPPFLFCALSTPSFIFLSASCRHWRRATQALAAVPVIDAAALGHKGEEEQKSKQRKNQNKKRV